MRQSLVANAGVFVHRIAIEIGENGSRSQAIEAVIVKIHAKVHKTAANQGKLFTNTGQEQERMRHVTTPLLGAQ